jgi:hypothetical protein
VIIIWRFVYHHISFNSRTNFNTGDGRGGFHLYSFTLEIPGRNT